MTDNEDIIAYCHACGAAMNVTALPPFTNCSCPTCGKHTRVKREFGPYTLMHRHAAGGMSMVFGAHDNTLDREVAIKILNETYSSDERRIAAFEHEAKLTASLGHPHIVKVLTTGQAFGYFYIAMEFVPGGHLEHQIREQGKIPEVEMLNLAIEVAQGLRAAHAAGLLHRDIKPGNILLDADGHAKLVDFGLALVTQGGKATAAEIWATPYYVPPETIEGAEEDLRSDIYAFGSTLYHALAGIPPCSETSMATEALRHAKRHVIPLTTADPSISPETAALVDKAMAFLPEHRFQSYDELLAALTRARGIAISGHHQPSESELRRMRLMEKRQRQQRIALFSVISIVVVFILLIALSGKSRKPKDYGSPPAIPPPTNGNASVPEDSSAADLARSYNRARTSLENKEYSNAAEVFAKLLAHPKFQEPSRTMAGVESVLAAYLDGKPRTARNNAKNLQTHLRDYTGKDQILTPTLAATLDGLHSLQPLATPKPGSTPGAQDVIASMLAGLKNWEHGMIDKAVPCFRQASTLRLSEDDKWASIYQNRARDYLDDFQILSSPVFAGYPNDRQACRKAGDDLESMLSQAKTRGRTRYNIRAWQEDIRRHALLLGSRTAAPNPAPSSMPNEREILARISNLQKSFKFREASLAIMELSSDPNGVKRSSLLSATEAASSFLTDLQKDIAKGRVAADLTLRNGRKVSSISLSEDGRLVAQTDAGVTPFTWQDVTPDALITLHRTLVRGTTSDGEVLRRHECAIWFDWMAGSRERAVQAAEKLGQTNESFAKRWNETIAGLSAL
jgi:eukaryotic-like serine/threonine-protein kinase